MKTKLEIKKAVAVIKSIQAAAYKEIDKLEDLSSEIREQRDSYAVVWGALQDAIRELETKL